ncbi:sigma 54-interacting transcriptional regulator [Pirellulaceae bacterium SH501]
MTKVLVIDDDRMVRHIVSSGLTGYEGLQVLQASDGDSGLRLIEQEQPSVLLLDIFLPEHNGLELFRKIRAINGKIPVIFITADTSSETAIQAMRAGAFDYLSKPLNVEQVRNLTISAVRARKAMDQPVAFSIGEGMADGERFIGRSKAMVEVYKSIGRVAAQNVTVLIRGESGCGKELVARAIMQNSNRAEQPYVAVNCAAIPDQLLESELFGHEKGAFTGAEKRRIGRFEQCDGGTIFLDEIGDMSQVTQGKVLRLLQEQKFERVGGNEVIQTNVRIIAATNRPLEEMVDEGTFREDLLYRLNGFTIFLPPLRERPEDIPLLLEYFFRRAKHDMSRPELEGISPEAFELLQRYDWPGNVRQLQSVVRQSVLNTTGTVIASINLPDFVQEGKRSPKSPKAPVIPETREDAVNKQQDAPVASSERPRQDDLLEGHHPSVETLDREIDFQPSADPTEAAAEFRLREFVATRMVEGTDNLYAEALEQMERRLFAQVLEATGGNQSKAAEILGITRGKVRDRIASFGIQVEKTVSISKKSY